MSIEIEKAFLGKFTTIRGNKIIVEYCQSCHNHKKIEPNEHVVIISKYYKNESYIRSTECRTCHFITTNIWRNIKHHTIYPKNEKKIIKN